MICLRKISELNLQGKKRTKFGGILLVRKFLRGLRVKEELDSAVGIEKMDGRFTVDGMLVSLTKVKSSCIK
jgi:hypothetical protein